MPFTTVDPRTALVVIDLQKGIAALPPPEAARSAIANAARLIQLFRETRRPVVLINVVGAAPGRAERKRSGDRPADWTDRLPDLGYAPDDIRLSKKTWAPSPAPVSMPACATSASRKWWSAASPPAWASNRRPASPTNSATTCRCRSTP